MKKRKTKTGKDTSEICIQLLIILFLTDKFETWVDLNTLTPELNLSAQRCMTIFFIGEFDSWTVHFVNIYVKTQQIHQLFIQFNMYGSSYMFRHYIVILRERS
jgi:hypothetical protein